jgi:hypothetical protein
MMAVAVLPNFPFLTPIATLVLTAGPLQALMQGILT